MNNEEVAMKLQKHDTEIENIKVTIKELKDNDKRFEKLFVAIANTNQNVDKTNINVDHLREAIEKITINIEKQNESINKIKDNSNSIASKLGQFFKGFIK